MNAGELNALKESLPSLLKWASFLIQSDEIEKAEWLLFKGLPGYYRENVPQEVIELREKMYKFLMNTADYAMNREDNTPCDPDRARRTVEGLQRGQIIMKEVHVMNERSVVPHIYDMGPGEYWLPIGLKRLGYQFTYGCSYLSQTAYDKQKESFSDRCVDSPPPGSPQIFVANEIIEHLRSERDIVHCMNKAGLSPDQIHMSTPMYTFSQGCDGPWDSESNKGRGGHLRTYTPLEFMTVAQQMFSGFEWSYYPGQVQSIIGKKNQ